MNEKLKKSTQQSPFTVKDLHTENPRWCVGCGDFGIVMGLKRFMVNQQMSPATTVNVSGIGCSGRAPNYLNTYGVCSIHGRAIPIALGLAITRPDVDLFIHSGDGDALSIGGNHLIHGINKNFNCVFLMYDNELYALTKSQTSPTTRQNHVTNTQPLGTYLPPLNAAQLVLGIGASFIASTADWMPGHLSATVELAYKHKGFSFVHISQRCPHFDPKNFDHKDTNWFSFLTHKNGVPPEKRIAEKAEVIEHDPDNLDDALKLAASSQRYFGLFYRDPNKPRYDDILINQVKNTEQKSRKNLFDRYKI